MHVIGPLIRSHALRTVDHNQHGRVLYGGCWQVEAKKVEFKKQKLPCRKPLAPLNSLQQVVQVPDRPISAPAYVSPTRPSHNTNAVVTDEPSCEDLQPHLEMPPPPGAVRAPPIPPPPPLTPAVTASAFSGPIAAHPHHACAFNGTP